MFVPIAFMGGIAGQWFKPFALTIACSVLVSLFVSFSLDPMLSAYWPDPHVPLEQRPLLSRLLGRFNHWFDRQAEGYKGVIAWALDHRLAMVALALRVVRRRAGAAGDRPRRRRLRAGDGRLRVHHRPRDAARLEPRLHAAQGAGGRAASRGSGRRWPTPTPPSAAQGDAVDEGTVFVKLTPKAERSRSAGRGRRRHPPRSAAAGRRRPRRSATGFNAGREADPAAAAGAGRGAS